MANFSSIEREMMEDAFDMRGGRVLDFCNRTFSEFIEEHLGFDPYAKTQYVSLSKARILRSILKNESDSFSGKLILALIEYREFKGISNSGNKYIPKLIELGKNRLGKLSDRVSSNNLEVTVCSQFNTHKHLADLLNIENSHYTPQQKGYAFEKFLNQLFRDLSLNPRTSYRTDTDQIDGSFVLDGNTVLVEAKYQGPSPSKNDFILFSNKIATKSQFAKGLFICQAKIPKTIIDYFKLTVGKQIVAMTVEELYMILSDNQDLVNVIKMKFRYLDETGLVFKHYREL